MGGREGGKVAGRSGKQEALCCEISAFLLMAKS